MMYYKEKSVGYWIATYSVVKNLDALIEVLLYCISVFSLADYHVQYLKKEYPNADTDDDLDTFKFIQPGGCLQLHAKTGNLPTGWKVFPHKEKMKVCTKF